MNFIDNELQENKPKRSPSLLEYILNHRQDIIDKSENKHFEKLDDENKFDKETSTNDIDELIKIDLINKNKNTKNYNYYNSIKWYWIFLFYGFLGGIIINSISNAQILRYDMFFNILLSPIIYYHSPKNILINIPINKFFKFYTLPFIIGLCFRFLSEVPELGSFILDPKYIITTLDYILVFIICLCILIISIYYLFISSNPIVNSILLLLYFLSTFIIFYLYYLDGGNLHIHHYFLGLIIMLVSKNYHSNIIIIIHSISYGIFIEGISKWGFDKIAW